MKTMRAMKTAQEVIANSIYFDYDITSNAKRILRNLREEGYLVSPRAGTLPEIQRMYGSSVSSEHAASLMHDAYERGLADA